MAQAYDTIGATYGRTRRTEPRIAEAIRAALGDAGTVVNVGAGTGSYEPADRGVVAVEPSPVMVAQRRAGGRVVRALAERLPFGDSAFDAAMAVNTVHQWSWASGLREMRRVASRVVLFECLDLELHRSLWLVDEYLPALLPATEEAATLQRVADVIGPLAVAPVAVPHDCRDGFLGAFWRRPDAYLDPDVRAGISCFHRLPEAELADGLARLRRDLESGRWHERFGHLLSLAELDLGYRLVRADG